MAKLLTAEQVKARFRSAGKTVTEWAEENGYARGAVYRVLNGFDKAHYGKAHQIAVALGMKSDESQAA